jgi:hypothetical protein
MSINLLKRMIRKLIKEQTENRVGVKLENFTFKIEYDYSTEYWLSGVLEMTINGQDVSVDFKPYIMGALSFKNDKERLCEILGDELEKLFKPYLNSPAQEGVFANLFADLFNNNPTLFKRIVAATDKANSAVLDDY